MAATQGFNPRAMTEAQVINEFNVARSTLNLWRNAGAPHVKTGGRVFYDLKLLLAWVREREEKREDPAAELGADASAGASPNLERFRAARAGQEEMKLAKLKGEMFERSSVEAAFITAGSLFKNALGEWVVRLPEKLAGLDPKSIGLLLEQESEALQKDVSAQMMKATGDR